MRKDLVLILLKVAYIEADGIATTMEVVSQPGATWGLTRLSHHAAGADDYAYDSSAGAGSCAYVIDTGVDDTHPEFEGRAKLVKSFTSANTDDNGHGTHVSGTIASKTYGVAKNALVYGIKVLDAQGSGEWTTIVAGIQYAVTDSAARAASCPNGFVVNMSLGGGKQQSVNDAVDAASGAGLFFGIASG
jgi:subtilisin family serine protease